MTIFLSKYAQLLNDHNESLIECRKLGEAVDQTNMNLGEGMRATFLAQTRLKSLDEVFKSARVLHATKRKVIIQVENVYLFAGKFGQVVYDLPLGDVFSIGNFKYSQHSYDFMSQKDLLLHLGATIDGRDKGDDVYNYSQCLSKAEHINTLAAA